jgi:hypothetical protein
MKIETVLPVNTKSIESNSDLLKCILNGNKATYISVPITSGTRFLQWYKRYGVKLIKHKVKYEIRHYRDVIKPNLLNAKKNIQKLRCKIDGTVIDPIQFTRPEWSQDDYRYFWGRVIEQYVNTVIFLDGWQYSSGCSFEFLTATRASKKTLDTRFRPINRHAGLKLLEKAIIEIESKSLDSSFLKMIVDELNADVKRLLLGPSTSTVKTVISYSSKIAQSQMKDAILDRLAAIANIAQFISFEPDISLKQRFCRINGVEPNFQFTSVDSAIASLLSRSPEQMVNIRSFSLDKAKGEPLIYGLKTVNDVLTNLRKKASEGKITIVNETVDIKDGGISGVALGDILEFAPKDTPKCVDKPGVCSLPRTLGLALLETVYGFRPNLAFDPKFRVEFSIHPKKRGLRHEHTIVWELEKVGLQKLEAKINWPNRFSRMLGDKTFGLMIADRLGFPVPKTTVINRTVAPFQFGRQTQSEEIWLRTCPEMRVPGKYPTVYGWTDIFKLMEETNGLLNGNISPVVAVLAQESIESVYSGSLIPTTQRNPLIEGVRGRGDSFMVGKVGPELLPKEVINVVRELYNEVKKLLGIVEIEWVYDGKKAWIVQIHKYSVVQEKTNFDIEQENIYHFDVKKGLDELRNILADESKKLRGIVLIGDVGITSHFGDLLRKAHIPFIINRST